MPERQVQLSMLRNAAGAMLFLEAANQTYQAFGTMNSSPWTIENVGADDTKRRSMVEYVAHASIAAGVAAIVASYVAGTAWPFIGWLMVVVYLTWVYRRAARRGMATGSVGAGWFDTWGRRPG